MKYNQESARTSPVLEERIEGACKQNHRGISHVARNIAVAAATALTLYAGPAMAQCLDPRPVVNHPRSTIIHPLEVKVGDQMQVVREGTTIQVPYEEYIYIKPQFATIQTPAGTRRRLTTQINLQKLNTSGQWEFVRDMNGLRKIYAPRINPEQVGIKEHESARVIITYQDSCLLYQTTEFYIEQGKKPLSPTIQEPIVQNPVTIPQRDIAVPTTQVKPIKARGEIKIIGLMGEESVESGQDIVSDATRGIHAQAIIKGSDLMGWVSAIATKQNVEQTGYGGAQYSQSFRQLNAGLSARLMKVFVAEFESVNTQSGWTADRTPILSMTFDEARYNGLFLSGGVVLPNNLEKGYMSNTFVQLSAGIGKSTQSVDLTDNLFRNTTHNSTAFREQFFKAIIDNKYFRVTASAGSFKSANVTDGENDLSGNRSSIAATINIPLSAIKGPSNTYLSFFALKSTTDYEGQDAQVPEWKVNLLGAGMTIKW